MVSTEPGAAQTLVAATVAAGQATKCIGAKFKSLRATYDALLDSSVASTEAHTFDRPLLDTEVANEFGFVFDATFAGRKTDSLIAPHLFVYSVRGGSTPSAVAALSPQFNDSTVFIALVDDSVRFVWRPMQPPTRVTLTDAMWGPRASERLRFAPSVAEIERFLVGKKVTVAIAGRREAIRSPSLQRFAEVVRWARCPSDRPIPK